MAPWRLAILMKIVNDKGTENQPAMANPAKKCQRVERAILGEDGIFGENGKCGICPPKS